MPEGPTHPGLGKRLRILRFVPMAALSSVVLVGCDGYATAPSEQRIGPGGGQVFLADGKVSLSVPAGALTEEVWFTALPVTSIPKDDLVLAGTTYEIGPAGTHFNRPMALTISYEVGALPKGFGESGLALFAVSGNAWELSDGSSVNPAARSVSGQAMSLGKFGVLAMD